MTRDEAREKLIVALDVDGRERALELVDTLGAEVLFYKVGLQLFAASGPDTVRALKERGKKVFLDLKLHDIPATMERAARAIARMGADMTTAHCMAGARGLRAARAGLEAGAGDWGRPLLLAVTVLTSHTEQELESLFSGQWRLDRKVLEFAAMARSAGADGVVCSAAEVLRIKQALPEIIAVTPGVRLGSVAGDDQRRTSAPSQAVSDGADYVVVGRPITAAKDVVSAARAVLDDMAGGVGR